MPGPFPWSQAGQGREWARLFTASHIPSLLPSPDSSMPPNGDISMRQPGASHTFTVPISG